MILRVFFHKCIPHWPVIVVFFTADVNNQCYFSWGCVLVKPYCNAASIEAETERSLSNRGVIFFRIPLFLYLCSATYIKLFVIVWPWRFREDSMKFSHFCVCLQFHACCRNINLVNDILLNIHTVLFIISICLFIFFWHRKFDISRS